MEEEEKGEPAFEEEKPLDEGGTVETTPAPQTKKFNDHAPWKRIIVLAAGATMNYLLALLLIVLMFTTYGQPLYKVMARPEVKNEAGEVIYEAVGEGEYYSSGLKVGDIIERVNGRPIYLAFIFNAPSIEIG